MGFFDLFLGSDPTENWVVAQSVTPEFDLTHNKLNGAAIDSSIDNVKFLGPAESKSDARKGFFQYYSIGLEVQTDESKIVGFLFYWKDYLKKGFKPCQMNFTYKGEALNLSGSTTEVEILNLFGEPMDRDDDEDETILFYHNEEDDVNWDVEFDSNKTLHGLCIS